MKLATSLGRTFITMVVALALLGLGGVTARSGTANAAPVAPAQQQQAPLWCLVVPPEWLWLVPECRQQPSDPPGESVEATYAAKGPSAVTTRTASMPQSVEVTLFYPTNLGAEGQDHPVLVWGNGSGEVPSTYTNVLSHLASWGFVVVAPNSQDAGFGKEMVAGAQWAVEQNGNQGSALFQSLDTEGMGALGHSQGAVASINAQNNSGGLITTSVPIATPNQIWWGEDGPDISRARSVFFVSGTNDFLTNQNGQRGFFDTAPDEAAMGAVVGENHFSISSPNTRSLGYVTAWFKYKLEGDELARSAFAGSSPELLSQPGWSWQQVKNLP